MSFLSLLFLHCGAGEGSAETTAFADETKEKVFEEGSIISDGKDVAISAGSTNGQKAVMAVDAGFAGDGTVVNIPTGFTASQCKFTAAPANIEGSAISTSASINSSTGEVVCQKVVQERTNVPPETKSCVASYTILCIKEVANQ